MKLTPTPHKRKKNKVLILLLDRIKSINSSLRIAKKRLTLYWLRSPMIKSIMENRPFRNHKSVDKSIDKNSGFGSVSAKDSKFRKLASLLIIRFKSLNKNTVRLAIGGALCCVLIITVSFFSWDSTSGKEEKENLIDAYIVTLDGKNIGLVKNSNSVSQIMETIQRDYQDLYGMGVSFKQKVYLEKTHVEDDNINTPLEIESIIRKNIGVDVKALAILVDNIEFGYVSSEGEANEVLECLKAPYIKAAQESGNVLEEISFQEKIRFANKDVVYSKVETVDEIYNRLVAGSEDLEPYKVEAGDTFWSIAVKHKTSVENLLEANPTLAITEYLKPDQVINLSAQNSNIHVITVESVKYTESLPFETETRKDSNLLKDQTKVLQKGSKGKQEVVAKVYSNNGVEKEREILQEKVVQEPVKKVVLVGTKTPKINTSIVGMGDGSFIWPTKGTLTSYMGSRWGRFHAGIDIAGPSGTPIYASASGSIEFAGRSGGYGNLIRIKHNGNMVTYYGHLKSILVKKGQSVGQGQLIGYMGNTGNSTGSHLHFEVRNNGSPVNPLKYLK